MLQGTILPIMTWKWVTFLTISTAFTNLTIRPWIQSKPATYKRVVHNQQIYINISSCVQVNANNENCREHHYTILMSNECLMTVENWYHIQMYRVVTNIKGGKVKKSWEKRQVIWKYSILLISESTLENAYITMRISHAFHKTTE